MIGQIASALNSAHEMGLVHRDVKPANVLIVEGAGADDSNHVYLSDFGIAKQQSSNVTRTGMFIGTAEYASPEQIEGKDLDGRSDVYSLGCVLYQCLTGNPAFEKDSEVALIYAHLLESPPSPRAARPDLPPAIDEVVAKAMAKKPEDRYATARDLAAAVRQALTQPASESPPAPAAEPVAAASTPEPAAMTSAPASVVEAAAAPPAGDAPPSRPPVRRPPRRPRPKPFRPRTPRRRPPEARRASAASGSGSQAPSSRSGSWEPLGLTPDGPPGGGAEVSWGGRASAAGGGVAGGLAGAIGGSVASRRRGCGLDDRRRSGCHGGRLRSGGRRDRFRSGRRRTLRGRLSQRLAGRRCELARAPVTVFRLLRHRLGDHRVHRVGELWTNGTHRRRRLEQVRVDQRDLGLLVVRGTPCQAFVEHAAERVDVRAGIEILALDLLG